MIAPTTFPSFDFIDSQFDPVECIDERGSGKKIASKLVVAGGDAPPSLMLQKKFSILCRR